MRRGVAVLALLLVGCSGAPAPAPSAPAPLTAVVTPTPTPTLTPSPEAASLGTKQSAGLVDITPLELKAGKHFADPAQGLLVEVCAGSQAVSLSPAPWSATDAAGRRWLASPPGDPAWSPAYPDGMSDASILEANQCREAWLVFLTGAELVRVDYVGQSGQAAWRP